MSLASGSNGLDTSQDDPRLASTMSEDWYQGHKVVAMPSSAFGGLTIREVVSSRNNDSSNNNAMEPTRRRSHSAGRPSSRNGVGGSRNLIQDVYDRMGVNYSRASTSSSRYITNAATTNNNNSAAVGEPVAVVQMEAMESYDVRSGESNYSSNAEPATSRIVNNNTAASTGSGGVKMSDKFQSRYRSAATRTSTSTTTPDKSGIFNTNTNNAVTTASNNNAAMATRGRPTEARRGREPAAAATDPDEENLSEGQKRARSLSRGRKVIGQWPPSRPMAEAADLAQQPPPPPPPPIQPSPTDVSAVSAPVSQRQSHSLNRNSQNYIQDAPKITRSHSYDGRPQYGRRSFQHKSRKALNAVVAPTTAEQPMNMRIAVVHVPANCDNIVKDEKKETDDVESANSLPEEIPRTLVASPLPSIKDRINVFAGKSSHSSGNNMNNPNSPSSSPRRRTTTGSSNYARGALPPKVDIYQQKNQEQAPPAVYGSPVILQDYLEEEDDLRPVPTDEFANEGPPEPSAVPPSAAAVAAAEAAAKYAKPSSPPSKWTSGAGFSRGVANYWSGSTPGRDSGASPKSQPHTPGADEELLIDYDAGDAMSPMMNSHEDYTNSNHINSVTPKGGRNPLWAERNKVASYSGPATNQYINSMNNNNKNNNHSKSFSPTTTTTLETRNNSASLSAETIDRMVNERVQALWEAQLQAQLKVMEQKLEERLHFQMEARMHEQMPVALGQVSAKVEERFQSDVQEAEFRIDDRAQKHIRDVEMKMETLLRRWMDQMNQKITTRLDAIEASIKEQMQNPERHEI